MHFVTSEIFQCEELSVNCLSPGGMAQPWIQPLVPETWGLRRSPSPVLPFLFLWKKGKENRPKKKGFVSTTEALNSMEKKVMARLKGRTKVSEKAQNADFRRKPQIFADSPLLLENQAFGLQGRRRPQKTADFRRKPKIFAGNRRLGSVTLGASPLARP